ARARGRPSARLRVRERIPSRRRAADASRRAALLLLAIASGYDSSSRLARRAPRPPGSVRGFIHNLSVLACRGRLAFIGAMQATERLRERMAAAGVELPAELVDVIVMV